MSISSDKKLPKRFPEGEPGDFYVEHEVCTACGAPEAEAPDLIKHSDSDWGHCYFKKQPKTPGELDRAINAMQVSCIAGIRYGGKDEAILKRLYEMGLEAECDHKPVGNYKMIVWNKVTFTYSGTMQELYDSIIQAIGTTPRHIDKKISDFKTNNRNYFEFTCRWTEGRTGTRYKCAFRKPGHCSIEMFPEQNAWMISLRGASADLNTLLLQDARTLDVIWFDLDGNAYDPSRIVY